MHATLAELLENQKAGLLWVHRDGAVRYANGEAVARTGLKAGSRLADVALAQAVSAAVASQSARRVSIGVPGAEAADLPAALACRVLPGLSRDDAFVLIGNDTDEPDHKVAFDNLMMVIRTEMRDPLHQTKATLEAAHGYDAPLRPALERMNELLLVLNKLVDLAEVWGSDALTSADRIEIGAMLRQVWADVEPLATARNVTVRIRPHGPEVDAAALYGSRVWLHRVFAECLESALRASRRGATLDIELRQVGPRVLVVLRDCGAFAQAAPGAIALERGPDTGDESVRRMSAREQIGLRLCRHIVSLHGGHLREERQDGQRNFLIDLPTGAPHRAEDSQLDIAQAQRYARDLAALMARARTAKAKAKA